MKIAPFFRFYHFYRRSGNSIRLSARLAWNKILNSYY